MSSVSRAFVAFANLRYINALNNNNNNNNNNLMGLGVYAIQTLSLPLITPNS